MKKYIVPDLSIVNVSTEGILSTSDPSSVGLYEEGGDASEMRSRRNGFNNYDDDDFNEEWGF